MRQIFTIILCGILSLNPLGRSTWAAGTKAITVQDEGDASITTHKGAQKAEAVLNPQDASKAPSKKAQGKSRLVIAATAFTVIAVIGSLITWVFLGKRPLNQGNEQTKALEDFANTYVGMRTLTKYNSEKIQLFVTHDSKELSHITCIMPHFLESLESFASVVKDVDTSKTLPFALSSQDITPDEVNALKETLTLLPVLKEQLLSQISEQKISPPNTDWESILAAAEEAEKQKPNVQAVKEKLTTNL